MFRVVRRGRFRTLFRDDGPVEVRVAGEVATPPHEVGGKTYLTVTVIDADAAAALAEVDARVRAEAGGLAFSPLMPRAGGGAGHGNLVVKVPRDVRWASADGEPWDPREGARLELELRLGSFGGFGYCWLARRISRLPPSVPSA